MKVETVKVMRQPDSITLLSMQRRTQRASTPEVDHDAVRMKTSPACHFKEDQRLFLWTASRLESRFHTSPIVSNLGLKWPQVSEQIPL